MKGEERRETTQVIICNMYLLKNTSGPTHSSCSGVLFFTFDKMTNSQKIKRYHR